VEKEKEEFDVEVKVLKGKADTAALKAMIEGIVEKTGADNAADFMCVALAASGWEKTTTEDAVEMRRDGACFRFLHND